MSHVRYNVVVGANGLLIVNTYGEHGMAVVTLMVGPGCAYSNAQSPAFYALLVL